MNSPSKLLFFDPLTRLRVRMKAAYMKTMALSGVNETFVAHLWERQFLVTGALVTDTGVPLQVVYPGRRSHDGGPDFRNAIIATADATLWKGDVEVHVRASDWQAHGHHRDPRYNETVLHVVLYGDHPNGTILESGQLVPTLAVEDCLSVPLEALCQNMPPGAAELFPCQRAVAARGCRGLERLLDNAGDTRFMAKAAGFEADLSCQEPRQTLYEGVMTAMGYARNKESFRELARRLPLAVLEGMSAGKTPERQLQVIQALLLGAAGLLPARRCATPRLSGHDLALASSLEEDWREMKMADEPLPWQWRGVRPENLPPRRIAAMAHLLVRHMKEGLLEAVFRRISAGTPREAFSTLESALVTPARGFWADHFDFGLPMRRGSALLGQGRALEVIINVILPFTHAYGQATSEPRLARKALDMYRSCPPLPENEITREMAGLLLAAIPKMRRSARRQQGLIHLYKTCCMERRCEACVLGGGQARLRLGNTSTSSAVASPA